MKTAHTKSKSSEHAGFLIPDELAFFPTSPRPGELLTLEEEQSFGYQVLGLTISCIQAMICDLDIASSLVSDMRDAFTANGKADKAVALVKRKGLWVRAGTVCDEEFARLAHARINAIEKALKPLRAARDQNYDLFYLRGLSDLRTAFGQLVPYDSIVSRAILNFQAKSRAISAACRDFILYVSSTLSVPRKAVQELCAQLWASKDLVKSCVATNRRLHMQMDIQAKLNFKNEVIGRQEIILQLASESQVPVSEMLHSWTAFGAAFHSINRLQGTFASMNMGLVEKEVMSYGFATDLEQIRSAAYQGLTRAMTLYAPEKGWKFSSYATAWIKQMILRELVQQDFVRLPEGSHATLMRIKAVYADSPNASDDYVCETANVTSDELIALRPYLNGCSGISLDASIFEDEGGSLHSVLVDQNNDFAQTVEDEDLAHQVTEVIKAELTEREFFIISHRQELAGAEFMTQTEIANLLGTTAQNINRIEKGAMRKLSQLEGLADLWMDAMGA